MHHFSDQNLQHFFSLITYQDINPDTPNLPDLPNFSDRDPAAEVWSTTDILSRKTYSKDLNPRFHLQARDEPQSMPSIDAVLWPRDNHALQKIVKAANQANVELYPYGAGSGVCAGAVPNQDKPATPTTKRPKIIIDLKRLNQIIEVDTISQTCHVEAGIIGQQLEEKLNTLGFTMGHFPSSIYCSSFGGYLATRAAGQLSTYYGKMEDIVLSLTGVLPNGELFSTVKTPRAAMGPDFNHLFVGSEGTLAFLTSAWVKIHRLPEDRAFFGYTATSTEEALRAIQTLLQSGLRPAVIRIYDEDESRMLMGLKSGVKVVIIAEGTRAFVAYHKSELQRILAGFQFTDLGPEPAEHWWSHRYDVSYRQQQILSHRRMILDTFEVSACYRELPKLYRQIKNAAAQSIADKSQNEMFILLAHFSHFYHTGANIYFTLCGRASESGLPSDYYDRAWSHLLAECVSANGAVSHHHGIGRLKSDALTTQMASLHPILKGIKYALDPKNILNPANLGL